MNNAGYIKDITIKETDDIMQKIQEIFPILLGKDWTLGIHLKKNGLQSINWLLGYQLHMH